MGMPKMSDEDKMSGAKDTGALAQSVTNQMEIVNALLAKMRPEDRAYNNTVKTPGKLLLCRLSRAEQALLHAVDPSILGLGRQLDYCDLVHILMDQNGPTAKKIRDEKLVTRWRNCLRQHVDPNPARTRWAYPKMRLIGERAQTYLGWYDKEFWYLVDRAYADRRPASVYEIVDNWLGLSLPKPVAEAVVRFQKKAAELALDGISADQLTDVVRAEVARQRAAVPPTVTGTVAGIGRVWLGHEEIDRDVLEIGSISSARRRSRGRKSSNHR